MFGLEFKKPDFKQCPMFHKSHQNGTKLESLESDVAQLSGQMDKLILEQKVTMDSHIMMKSDVSSMKTGLEGHMKDEAGHHNNTTKAITELHVIHTTSQDALKELTASVTDLVTDQIAHRKDRELRENKYKIIQARKEKILTAVLSSLTLGATWWLFDVITHLDKVNKVLGAE